MNATITFPTRTRSNKAAPHVEPRSARRSILIERILSWLMSYPVEIV